MASLRQALEIYASEVTKLAVASTTNEATYYTDIKNLLVSILKQLGLPADVRQNTSGRRGGTGVDVPDVALYDGGGDFVTVFGEVKLPVAELEEMAVSTDQEDQIGRYLAHTGVVILCNVRGFGLVTVDPEHKGAGRVPPAMRRLEQRVELWPSLQALKAGRKPDYAEIDILAELVETAVTSHAPIAEPETLARVLARQARRAKADLPEEFTSAVSTLAEDFGNALGITFVGEDGEEFFRSSLVQTVFYGLFAGWCLWQRDGARKPFRWQDLADYLKIPFLGELFYEIRHPRRIKELNLARWLDGATETLGRVNQERFFQRLRLPSLGSQEGAEGDVATAIVYFYEPFLETFDPELRKELGVWYTPPEVVRYQVRRAEQLIKTELKRPLGFADSEVVVLDPCCGTGAYLIEVLQCMADTLREQGVKDEMGETLLEALCRRVLGFELLTAPFVIAHLQLRLILAALGIEPDENQRPGVFLTNALTGWDEKEQLTLNFPELQAERDAAQAVKNRARIIVVLGNPPYNRFAGAPVKEEQSLIDPYKGIKRKVNGKQDGQSKLYIDWKVKKHLLDDLYIRFFRLAEERIGMGENYGIVSLISNSSFVAGRSHPIMRESLIHSFHDIWVDNLNGDKYKTGKVIPKGESGEGSTDQSIFTTARDPRGIQVGVAITTMLKRKGAKQALAKTRYRDFWGKADDKRNALLESLRMRGKRKAQIEAWAATSAGPREYLEFTSSAPRRWKLVPYDSVGGYEDWSSLEELFPINYQGVNPNRGFPGSIIEFDSSVLAARMKDYYSTMDFDVLKEKNPILCKDRVRYNAKEMRSYLQKHSKYEQSAIVPYELFPYDVRYIYYEATGKLINEKRPELWENLAGNEFLIAVPEPRKVSEARPMFTSGLFDLHLHDRGCVGIPLQVKQAVEEGNLFNGGKHSSPPAQANLDPKVWETLGKAWGLKGGLDGTSAKHFVRQLMRVCLAVCHASDYQEEHRGFLAQDWAHIPIPKDQKLFRELAETGDDVATLLNPFADATEVIQKWVPNATTLAVLTRKAGSGPIRSRDLEITISYFGGAKGGWHPRGSEHGETTEAVAEGRTGDIDINDSICFSNVPEPVWLYELGGYPVLKKWLAYKDTKRRPGQPLTLEEKDSFRGIVQRISGLSAMQSRLGALYGRAASNAWTRQELGLE